MYQVIDRAGHVLELADDVPCPDGCRLLVSARFMDSAPSWDDREDTESDDEEDAGDEDDEDDDSADAFAITDEMRERAADARADYIDRLTVSMRRHRVVADDAEDDDEAEDVADEAADPREAAWRKMRKRLGKRVPTAGPPPPDRGPSWQRAQPRRPRKRRGIEFGGTAGDGVNDAAAEAYDARNRWLQDRWRTARNRGDRP